jgi:hypothetical protein
VVDCAFILREREAPHLLKLYILFVNTTRSNERILPNCFGIFFPYNVQIFSRGFLFPFSAVQFMLNLFIFLISNIMLNLFVFIFMHMCYICLSWIPAQIGRSFVVSKLKDYPKFRSVAIAIRGSGFKVCKDHISLKTEFSSYMLFFPLFGLSYC